MRLALGAGRGRIVRQLLFESVSISAVWGVVGLLFASWGNALLASYYGTEIDGVRHAYTLTIDWPALILTMAVATATGIAFGLLPAVVASRTELIPALKKDAASQGFRRSRFGAAFLVAQVSISVVLVIGAALLIHSVRTLRSDPGFDVANVPYSNEATPERLRSGGGFELFPQRAAPPRIASARWNRSHSSGSHRRFRLAPCLPCLFFYPAMHHRARSSAPCRRSISSRLNSSRRCPYQSSEAGRSMPAILNRAGNLLSSIRCWLRGCGPLPIPSVRRVRPRRELGGADAKPSEVIGVAQYPGLRPGGLTPGVSLFRADWASAAASGRMLVRVKGDSRTMLPLFRQEIVAVDPNVAISEALPLSSLIENMYTEVPLAMRVVGYTGGLGLLLTAIGLYAVLALAVGQRTREIGVRMALGARVPSILTLILREGMALALAGLALGLASAIVLSGLLTRFLYGSR